MATPRLTITRTDLAAVVEETSAVVAAWYTQLVELRGLSDVELRERFAALCEAWWRRVKAWGARAEHMIDAQIDDLRKMLVQLRQWGRVVGERGIAVSRALDERLQRIADAAELRLFEQLPGGELGLGVAVLGLAVIVGALVMRGTGR